ncbi:intermembrane transport protein PqiB [Halofilum ochraceum]|uniref:intermembrane transport protein PqiB n=1 Tax=Halofilum ochraceum TaxID=1611323 RepID=UPI0008D924C2|nr:intermembrane transport protein PqiB [Halofilum ochraceum]
MTDTGERAIRRRQLRISPLWLLPLVALVIGGWMAYERFAARGPTVTLRMPDAEGIEAGKTLVKTRNVEVGRVQDVRLSEDLGHTVVEAQLRADAERMLNENTQFWVVKPRIGSQGISGLDTALSGAYIALQPGDAGAPRRHFEVLENPPVTGLGEGGLQITLLSGPEMGLTEGAPVTYHGMTVGRVTSVQLDASTREIEHQVFIESPYTELVTAQTRFWSSAGLSVNYSADGFSVDVQSLETLLGGGISLGVPDTGAGATVKPGHRFRVYRNQAAVRDAAMDQYLEYVVLLEDSVEGVSEGSAVRYRGVRIGTVDTVAWHFDGPRPGADDSLAVPVLVRLEPQRLTGQERETDLEAWRKRISDLIDEGLRASVKSESLITGTSYVALDMSADPGSVARMSWREHPVIPATTGGMGRLQDQMGQLLEKLNTLEIQSVLTRLEGTAESSQATFRSVQRTAASIQALLDDSATRELPRQMDEVLGELRSTLEGFDQDSELYQQLNGVLGQMEAVMQDLRPLVRTLREQPNALIFDREEVDDPEPRAPPQ